MNFRTDRRKTGVLTVVHACLRTLASLSLLWVASLSGQLTPAQKADLRADVKARLAANKPITFYGRVLDQASMPVKDVKVILSISSWFDPNGKGDDYDQRDSDYAVVTDGQGRFDFRGAKGTSLEVELQRKEGFLYSPETKRRFSFDPTMDHPGGLPVHRPDAQSPVIFRVWRAQGGETVVEWGPGKEVKQDGTLIAADLLALEFRPAGSAAADFRVALKAEIPPGARADYKCRWSVRIEAVDGGVVLTDDEYMYLAPESGYQPAVEFTFDPTSVDWDRDKTFKFYLRSSGGKHSARVTLHVAPRPDLSTGLVSFQSVINFTGSRNLEEGKVLPYLPNTR